MKKLISIGEALIDFIPRDVGKRIADVSDFKPKVGGAPANVCGAFVKLGGKAEMITQLGDDPFGDKIVEEFAHYGIGSAYVKRTQAANTALAFVALKEDGNREFSFYRKPSADMLMSPDDIQKEWFDDGFALHYCSVSLGEYPMKYAHERAIKFALDAGLIISFDPNLRRPLWNNDEELYRTVHQFIPSAHILKISDEELEFLTGKTSIEDAKEQLFVGNVQMIIYTKGANGAECYTKNASAFAPSEKVKAVDTTGAGDAFIGAFLYKLYENGIRAEDISKLTEAQMAEYLEFANKFSGYSVQRPGAIASYPTKEEYDSLYNKKEELDEEFLYKHRLKDIHKYDGYDGVRYRVLAMDLRRNILKESTEYPQLKGIFRLTALIGKFINERHDTISSVVIGGGSTEVSHTGAVAFDAKYDTIDDFIENCESDYKKAELEAERKYGSWFSELNFHFIKIRTSDYTISIGARVNIEIPVSTTKDCKRFLEEFVEKFGE